MSSFKVTFINKAGAAREIRSDIDGISLMQVATENGVVEINGECGGNLSCATCHAYIDPEWFDRLTPPDAHELEMLDGALDVRPNSRLTCQIALSDALDGLVVHLPEAQY